MEKTTIKPNWDFVYDQENWDHQGPNFSGILQDKNNLSRVLFWHALTLTEEDKAPTCFIYSNMFLNEEELVCEYPWTSENDSILVNALNALDDPNDYCGDDSPIRFLEFLKLEDCEGYEDLK